MGTGMEWITHTLPSIILTVSSTSLGSEEFSGKILPFQLYFSSLFLHKHMQSGLQRKVPIARYAPATSKIIELESCAWHMSGWHCG